MSNSINIQIILYTLPKEWYSLLIQIFCFIVYYASVLFYMEIAKKSQLLQFGDTNEMSIHGERDFLFFSQDMLLCMCVKTLREIIRHW